MKKELIFQLKNAFFSRNFLLISLISVCFGIGCFIIKCVGCFGEDIINIPAAYEQYFANARSNDYMVVIFSVASPFLVSAAFADSYVAEYYNRYVPVCIIRTGKNKYYFSKMIAVFICGAFVMMLPQIINLILCLIAFPLDSTRIYTWDLWQADIYTIDMSSDWFLFKALYVLSPYLYFVLFMLLSGVMAGIIAVIGYELSFFIRNKIFAVSAMFIFINLSNFLFENYAVAYRIWHCMFGLSVGGNGLRSFYITCAAYLAAAVLLAPFSLRRLKNCY